eukprot:COSAG05_NODE_1090_length_5919_cov_8.497938_2_plen_87_part_00
MYVANESTKKRRADTVAKVKERDTSNLCQIVDPETGMTCANLAQIRFRRPSSNARQRYCNAGPSVGGNKKHQKLQNFARKPDEQPF